MILDEDLISSTLVMEALMSPELPAGAFIEIGSGPGSTSLVAGIAQGLDRAFKTIDVSASAVAQARGLLGGRANMEALRSTGEDFLARFSSPIAFAYMDGYEWVDSATAGPEYPPGLSKRESELVHLRESILLLPRVPRHGWVLFDDTWLLEKSPPSEQVLNSKVDFSTLTNRTILEHYGVFGKGSVAVPFLLTCGFKLQAVSERPHKTQVLLTRVDKTVSEGPYSYEYFTTLVSEHRQATYPTGGFGRLIRRPIPSLRRMRRAFIVGAYRRMPGSIQPIALKIRRALRRDKTR